MQTIEDRVNELIKVITDKCEKMGLDAREVFLNGNCGNMYTIFAKYFYPAAVTPYEILYKRTPYHIVSKIGDKFYDITGETTVEKYKDYLIKNNSDEEIDENAFEIQEIPPQPLQNREDRIRMQSDAYENNTYGRSEINDRMYNLEKEIERFKDSKEK